VEFFAVGAFAGAGSWAGCCDSILSELGSIGFNVVAQVSGPADKARFGKLLELVEQGGGAARLLRVGSDDFQIPAGALGG